MPNIEVKSDSQTHAVTIELDERSAIALGVLLDLVDMDGHDEPAERDFDMKVLVELSEGVRNIR